jgi:hypothetical protein
MAGPLKSLNRRKERTMWVFDGEEWKREGETEEKKKPDTYEIPMEALLPQLQVVEILPVTVKRQK